MWLILGFELTTWLIGTVVAVGICYWYKSNANHYWKSKNVPSDSPKFSIGGLHVGALLTGKSVWLLDEEQYKKHGKLCGIYHGTTPMLLVSDPELIKTVLVKDFHIFHDRKVRPSGSKIEAKIMSKAEGDEWKRLRSIVTPVFTPSKMKKLAPLISKSCESITNSFVKIADSKKPVDLLKQYGAFALDVIASTVFGTNLDAINNPDDVFVIHAQQSVNVKLNKALLFLLAPKLMKKLGIGLFDPKHFDFYADLVLKNRKQRENGGKVCDDVLQMLMDIESETTEEKDSLDEKHYGAEGGITRSSSKFKTLTSDELVAQCIMFLVFGSDTTMTTLSFISYLLALNPGCQNRLVEEVDQTWEKYDGKIGYDAVHSMKYLEAVIAETLRLYPPATRLTRRCVQDHVLGETGIFIPKGMHVSVPVYVIQRDPAYFSEPEEFNPERFLPENIKSIEPYTYLPFGSGPRNCIGMRLAQTEIKLCLVHVLRQVTFEKCQETEIPLQYKKYTGVDAIQPKSITVGVKRRH